MFEVLILIIKKIMSNSLLAQITIWEFLNNIVSYKKIKSRLFILRLRFSSYRFKNKPPLHIFCKYIFTNYVFMCIFS